MSTTTSIVVPDGRITLLDIVKKNGSDAVVGLVDETIRAVPEIAMGSARTIKGLTYKTLIRKSLPSVGFRNANEGGSVTKSVYENRLIETYILNPRIECDQAVADKDEDGPEAYIAMEASAVMEASFQLLGKQFYYGSSRTTYGGDAKGFPGLLDFVDSSLVIDAGGTTVNTASSVWFVIFGQKNVNWVYGANGQLAVKPTRVGDIVDKDGNRLTGYISEVLAYPGLQCVNKYSVVRIKNLTNDSGKGLTDALLGKAFAALPAGVQNLMQSQGVILMNPREREHLRSSRTTFSPTGLPAPIPTDFQGIPIQGTDSISTTEAIDLA